MPESTLFNLYMFRPFLKYFYGWAQAFFKIGATLGPPLCSIDVLHHFLFLTKISFQSAWSGVLEHMIVNSHNNSCRADGTNPPKSYVFVRRSAIESHQSPKTRVESAHFRLYLFRLIFEDLYGQAQAFFEGQNHEGSTLC